MVDKELGSDYLKETMTLRIYSPAKISTSYPFQVCIMQDGNDYYQMGRIATLSDRLHDDQRLHNTIFVGIHYQDRFDRKKKYHPDGEQNPAYMQFLAKEVFPFIDGLIPETKYGKSYALMGDSLAGTLALMTAISHPDLFDKYIFNDTTAAARRLEPDSDVRAEKITVGYKQVAHTAGHFTPHHKTAVTVKHRAVPHDHIFRRHAALPPLFVASRFDADPVIAHVELTVFDQHIPA